MIQRIQFFSKTFRIQKDRSVYKNSNKKKGREYEVVKAKVMNYSGKDIKQGESGIP